MLKENLYIGYIDGSLSDSQKRELEDMLAKEGGEAEAVLFETKDIADTARYGSMPVREQERKIISLMSQAEKSDRLAKRRHLARHIIGYAAIALFAFILGTLGVSLRQSAGKDMIAIHAYAGNKTGISLPDGTNVTLKSSSTLEYDVAKFGTGVREVHLNGEAYFDVSNVQGSKFIITTQRQRVTVHGTTFNLQAYDNDSSNTLTLLEGNVSIDLFDTEGKKIRSLDINPLEKCTWDLRTGHTHVEKIDNTESELGWSDNIFYFRDMNITEIAERLEKYYNVNITTFGLGNGDERFSGALSLNQNIGDIMCTLNYDKGFCIKRIDDRHFSISKKETQKP